MALRRAAGAPTPAEQASKGVTLDQPTIASITLHAVRLYGEGMYLVRVNNSEATLEGTDGEVLYRASAVTDPDHLAALERLLAARAARRS